MKMSNATAELQLCTDYSVELRAFDPVQPDLRPNCAAAQFAKPPTPLRDAEWGTLRGDFGLWQEGEIEVD